MAIVPGTILDVTDLRAGDILIAYDDDTPDHSMLWVGDPKPVAHSSASDDTSGIVRQSINVLNLGDGEPAIEVHRISNGVMAQKATQIALTFSVASNDPRYVFAKNNAGVSLPTVFSQHRLGGDGGVWGPEAVVRAVRAYARFRKGQPLSAAVGVTCSQFVTYTYQAAAVAWLMTRDRLAAIAVEQICNDRSPDRLLMHNAPSIGPAMARVAAAYAPIRPLRNALDLAMPAAMKVNASVTSVDVLTQGLHGDPRWVHVGNLCGEGSDSDSDSDT